MNSLKSSLLNNQDFYMLNQHHRVILPFDNIQKLDKTLIQEFPFIHYNLPNGMENIYDAAINAFSLEEHDHNVYLEECVDLINTLIDEENVNAAIYNEFDNAATELYSPLFYDFLMSIFIQIKDLLGGILVTPNFIIINKTYLTNRKCLMIEVDING